MDETGSLSRETGITPTCHAICPSFVQSLSLFKWVSRAKQSLPVISLEIPVRPSVVDKNQTLRNLAQSHLQEGANPQTYQCQQMEWTKSNLNARLDGTSQQQCANWWKSKRKQICRNRKSRKSEQTDEQHWKAVTLKLQALVNIKRRRKKKYLSDQKEKDRFGTVKWRRNNVGT